MKRLALFTLLLCGTTLLSAANTPSLTGNWQVHMSIAGQEYDSTCTFAQKESDLTGSCKNSDGGNVDVTGKVDGGKVSWSYKTEYNGTPITVQHQGTLEGDKVSGTVNVPEYSAEGEFTATPATAPAQTK